MKERPILFSGSMVRAILDGTKTQTRRVAKLTEAGHIKETGGHRRWHTDDVNAGLACPYGQPGDQLWVRETWAYGVHAMNAKSDEDGPFVYAADGTSQGRLCDRWRPSIHLPSYASRITLEITVVRVERLRDISESDSVAEGAPWSMCCVPQEGSHRVGYAQIWESINGAGSWDANPWVWVIEFQKLRGGAA